MSQLFEDEASARKQKRAICYYGCMERVLDKSIILVCCLMGLLLVPWKPELTVALLIGVVTAALAEVVPKRFSAIAPIVLVVVALFIPEFAIFLPLATYDLVRDTRWPVRLLWLIPAVSALAHVPTLPTAVMLVVCAIAVLLSFRTARTLNEKATYWRLRNDVREASFALEEKNRGLREKQDMEVHLATLAERGRIAREIHDNVGHLLTRSIMQVEALQVVHRADAQIQEELEQVGATLHEAMSTVRASVHNLHDDAFNLETKLAEAAESCASLEVRVDYRADDVPSDVGYCFIAIVREALSNAAKHSDAYQVMVSVAAYPAFFRLVVHDNGSRFPREVLSSSSTQPLGDVPLVPKGMGLTTMADRVRALGGALRLDYDQGFRVFVTVPRKEAL